MFTLLGATWFFLMKVIVWERRKAGERGGDMQWKALVGIKPGPLGKASWGKPSTHWAQRWRLRGTEVFLWLIPLFFSSVTTALQVIKRYNDMLNVLCWRLELGGRHYRDINFTSVKQSISSLTHATYRDRNGVQRPPESHKHIHVHMHAHAHGYTHTYPHTNKHTHTNVPSQKHSILPGQK